MTKNLYVDIHVIQTLPPSCVNRDDMGSPKTAVYGGAVRARVSSQAWKHAMRESFKSLFDEKQLGKRTKRIVALVAEKIVECNSDIDENTAKNMAIKLLKTAGLDIKSPEKGTGALFFLSDRQATALGEAYEPNPKDKTEYEKKIASALREHPSVDIALFGRMVAKDATFNCEASAQVAHAISTHKVQTEYDYFTAVDDCAPQDSAGAGHLGTVEFNSSTMYRYATVNVRELNEKIEDNISDVVKKFVQAFVLAMPTGKQNTFANRTVPDMVYVAIRDDQPVNMCGAFEKPVNGKDGYVEESERRLLKYLEDVYDNFVEEPVKSYIVGGSAVVDNLERVSFKEMLSLLSKDIEESLKEG